MKFLNTGLNALSYSAILAMSSNAYSQNALEEVVVTATKSGSSNIQNIAGTVNAIGGDDLAVKGSLDFENFAGSVPGLNFQDLGPGDKEYIIRGINGNGPSVVGAYFDDYVMSATDQLDGGGKNAPIKMVDIDRVEVLNGPQGTLYGASSMAGTIRFIAKKPSTDAVEGFLNADLSSTEEGGNNYTLQGAINIPIIEGVLGARIVGYQVDNDGWIDQPRLQTSDSTFDGNAEDINTEDTKGGRIQVRWTPNDRFTLDTLYLNQAMETGGSSRFTQKGVPAWPDQPADIASLGAGFAAPAGLESITPTDDYINTDILKTGREDDVEIFGFTAAYEADVGTYTLAASQFNHDIEYVLDNSPVLAFFGFGIPNISVQPQSYQTNMVEARFASDFDGPVNFVAGAYYQENKNDVDIFVTTTDGRGGPVAWDPANDNDALTASGTAVFGRFRRDSVEQVAAYTEVTYEFLQDWTFLAGLRWFDSDIESLQATTHRVAGGLVTAPAEAEVVGTTSTGNPISRIQVSDNTVRPKFSLSYQAMEEVMLYGLYSEGFRVGGVNNANAPFSPGVPASFDSDQLNNLEFGIKSRWFDGQLQLNASLFMVDWKDIQVEPRDPGASVSFIVNGGEAQVNGLEWSVDWLATDALSFAFSGTYFSKYELTEDQPDLPASVSAPYVITGSKGDNIPNIPEYQFYLSTRYSTDIAGKPTDFVADITYRGESYTEFDVDSPFATKLDSYTLLDLYATTYLTDQLSLGAYVKNATDELAIYDTLNTFQDPHASVAARPRTVGASLKFEF